MEKELYRNIECLYTRIKEAKQNAGAKVLLFIDEVQEIDRWEKCVNSFLTDGDADIYISGSNSNLLSGELATFLSGRYVEFPILTLTFSEYVSFRNKLDMDDKPLFFEFIRFGGMPGIHHLDLSEEAVNKYLAALIDSMVLKDVVIRNRIRNVGLLERLIRYIADNSGNIVSARSVADYFKKERRTLGIETVYNYLTYLETAFIASKENARIYIQVAYVPLDEQTREREFKPLRLVQDNFPKYVVTMDEAPAGNDNGIIRMYLLDFLVSDAF